jgi:hypothetical protein
MSACTILLHVNPPSLNIRWAWKKAVAEIREDIQEYVHGFYRSEDRLGLDGVDLPKS